MWWKINSSSIINIPWLWRNLFREEEKTFIASSSMAQHNSLFCFTSAMNPLLESNIALQGCKFFWGLHILSICSCSFILWMLFSLGHAHTHKCVHSHPHTRTHSLSVSFILSFSFSVLTRTRSRACHKKGKNVSRVPLRDKCWTKNVHCKKGTINWTSSSSSGNNSNNSSYWKRFSFYWFEASVWSIEANFPSKTYLSPYSTSNL